MAGTDAPEDRDTVASHTLAHLRSHGTLARLLVATAMTLAAAPAQAQTYDPNYPICLQTFGRNGNSIACGYTSMVQCKMSASGRAAQCVINPYFAGVNPGRTRRPYRIR
jgi:hypothetical protein